jgi:hypothetical protein
MWIQQTYGEGLEWVAFTSNKANAYTREDNALVKGRFFIFRVNDKKCYIWNERRTVPCITVWNTQGGDFIVSTGVLGMLSGYGISGVWMMLMLLVPWCPVPGTDAGFRTWTSEALKDTDPHLLCIPIHFCKLPYPVLHKAVWNFIIRLLPHWVLKEKL